MTKYTITLYSKDNKSLDRFLKFLKYRLKVQKVQEPLNYKRKKKKKKMISVLTSPHVNKTAQEQFEYTVYSVGLSFYSSRTKMCLVLLKKIKNQLFPDVGIKINTENNIKKRKHFLREISLNPDGFTFNLSQLSRVNQRLCFKELGADSPSLENRSLLRRTSHYLEILHWYGI